MRVGAYSLCYQEGEILAANISLMYEFVDKFVIVIGQVEVSASHTAKMDTTSRSYLLKIRDPLNKIDIFEKPVWDSKDEMALIAQKALHTEILIQLDADEFWSKETLEAGVREIEKGANRVLIPHIIYFRGAKYQLTSKDLGDYYFSPPRMWLKTIGAELGHFSGSQSIKKIHINNVDSTLPTSFAIHHLGWVQRKQIRRKISFYTLARNYKMPSSWKFIFFWKILQLNETWFELGPNKVRIEISQTSIPQGIKSIAERYSKNKQLL